MTLHLLLQLLEKAVLCRTSQDFGMENVKQVHAKIQEQIADSQAKTTRILEEHEKVCATSCASSFHAHAHSHPPPHRTFYASSAAACSMSRTS